MKTLTRVTSLSATFLLLAGAAACNIHDNTINIPNATINATANADVSNVAPMQEVAITVVPQNIFLCDMATTPPPEHMNDAGDIQVFMDDVDSQPILVTATATFNVTIPAATKPGPHNLICRFRKHDGTPTTTQSTVAITVSASASVGADGGVDASVGIDASVTTTTTTGAGGATGTTTGAAGAGG